MFFQGGLGHRDLEEMPWTRIIEYAEYAAIIQKEEEKRIAEQQRRSSNHGI